MHIMIILFVAIAIVIVFVYVPILLNSYNWKNEMNCHNDKEHDWKFVQCIYKDTADNIKQYVCTDYECSICGEHKYVIDKPSQLDYDNVKFIDKNFKFVCGIITPYNEYTAYHLNKYFNRYTFKLRSNEKIEDETLYEDIKNYLEDPNNKFIGTYELENE